MTDPGFAADVRKAAAVWRGSWGVPAVYLLLGLSYLLLTLARSEPPDDCVQKALGRCPLPPDEVRTQTLLSLALMPLLLFHIGLSGSARVWYLRRFSGERLESGELWSLSWRFFGRFFLLGLLALAVSFPLVVVSIVLTLRQDSLVPLLVVSAVGALLVDVLFTFATPSLAYYTDNPWRALTGGVGLLRRAWPECALYALVPPMALLLLAQGSPDALGKPVAAVFALVSPLLTLLFAGASAAFVLRRRPALGPEGSLGAPRWEPAPFENR
jgi:hypothetical protein